MHWNKQLKKGLSFLTQSDLHKALKCFETSVTDCPVTDIKGLDKSLFFLGITLSKLGREESALKCWNIAKETKYNGLSAKMLKRHSSLKKLLSNQYNVEKDKTIFFKIQVKKYLKKKKVCRFCSDAEKDVICDIINEYWLEILSCGNLNHLSLEKKMIFFKNQMLIFPFSNLSSFYGDNNIIKFTDFDKNEQDSTVKSFPKSIKNT